jgi:GH24 family phage-related lysozyme (muramidase)
MAGQAPRVGPKIGFAAVPLALVLALSALLAEPGHEQRVYTTYWDKLGQVYTVCAGVTGSGVIPGRTYTDAECQALETRYISRMYARMGRCAPKAEMEFHEIKAWGHFAYNVGEANFCASKAAKLLNAGENEAACRQIPRWVYVKGRDCRDPKNKCPGIPRRREWEYRLCEGRA